MKKTSGHESVAFFVQRFASFRYAIRGLGCVIRSEPNAKIHLAVTVAVVVAGVYFGLSINEWCAVTLAIGLVLAAEIINTAIEQLVDIVSPNYNVTAGRVKDIAAGATLVAAGCAFVVGALIFGPRILLLINP